MAEIVGIYDHQRSENLDGYLKAIGVPYIGRKMACASNPRVEISRKEDKLTIKNATVLWTTESTFVPGVEYEETVPSGHRLKNVTNLEGNSLVTTSAALNGSLTIQRQDFTDEGLTVTMTHEESGQVAKRFYKRVAAI